MRSPISAVTIVKSRTEKLTNLITQLEQCSPTPDELVIVWMAPPSDLSLVRSDKFDIVHKFVTQDALPIAKARNKGMSAAKHANLVYLNVDAVIAPSLFRDGLLALRDNTVVFTSVVFLPNERCCKPYQQISKDESIHRDEKASEAKRSLKPEEHDRAYELIKEFVEIEKLKISYKDSKKQNLTWHEK